MLKKSLISLCMLSWVLLSACGFHRADSVCAVHGQYVHTLWLEAPMNAVSARLVNRLRANGVTVHHVGYGAGELPAHMGPRDWLMRIQPAQWKERAAGFSAYQYVTMMRYEFLVAYSIVQPDGKSWSGNVMRSGDLRLNPEQLPAHEPLRQQYQEEEAIAVADRMLRQLAILSHATR